MQCPEQNHEVEIYEVTVPVRAFHPDHLKKLIHTAGWTEEKPELMVTIIMCKRCGHVLDRKFNSKDETKEKSERMVS